MARFHAAGSIGLARRDARSVRVMASVDAERPAVNGERCAVNGERCAFSDGERSNSDAERAAFSNTQRPFTSDAKTSNFSDVEGTASDIERSAATGMERSTFSDVKRAVDLDAKMAAALEDCDANVALLGSQNLNLPTGFGLPNRTLVTRVDESLPRYHRRARTNLK